MNPHQKNKIDLSKLSEDELRVFRLYGKVPNTKDLLQNKFKERKYFDSGDYALSKAGKASDAGVTSVGSQHPLPENIPHLTSPSNGGGNGNGGLAAPPPGPQSVSPVKESSFLHRETSADDYNAGELGVGAEGVESEQFRELRAAQQQQQQEGGGPTSPQQRTGRAPSFGARGSLSPGSEGKPVPIRWQS